MARTPKIPRSLDADARQIMTLAQGIALDYTIPERDSIVLLLKQAAERLLAEANRRGVARFKKG